MVDLLKREELLLGSNNQKQIDQNYQEFMGILKERDPRQFSEKLQVFTRNRQQVSNVQVKALQITNASLSHCYDGKPFKIIFPLFKLKAGKSEFVKCEAYIGHQIYKCLVTCGHLDRLTPTSTETTTGQVHLLDHLPELLPAKGRSIGLFTFQNGINNSFEDFTLMGKSVFKHLAEKPLCIGLYNPHKGLLKDLEGVQNKLDGIISDSVCAMQGMIKEIATKLRSINPQLFWAHICHSEGGLIAQTVLALLQNDYYLADYLRARLFALTYGAVLPIPRLHAMSINNYSTGDIATWPRVRQMLKDLGEKAKNYDIRPLEPIVAAVEPYPENIPNNFAKLSFLQRLHLIDQLSREKQYGLYEVVTAAAYACAGGDHGFQGDTYQEALLNDIKDIKRKCI
ncbi:MAG: hypothetical protein LLG04_14060 [Parachlamydia sp.]|nr:hypothetical protein [Parachlamydia sp.]